MRHTDLWMGRVYNCTKKSTFIFSNVIFFKLSYTWLFSLQYSLQQLRTSRFLSLLHNAHLNFQLLREEFFKYLSSVSLLPHTSMVIISSAKRGHTFKHLGSKIKSLQFFVCCFETYEQNLLLFYPSLTKEYFDWVD